MFVTIIRIRWTHFWPIPRQPSCTWWRTRLTDWTVDRRFWKGRSLRSRRSFQSKESRNWRSRRSRCKSDRDNCRESLSAKKIDYFAKFIWDFLKIIFIFLELYYFLQLVLNFNLLKYEKNSHSSCKSILKLMLENFWIFCPSKIKIRPFPWTTNNQKSTTLRGSFDSTFFEITSAKMQKERENPP